MKNLGRTECKILRVDMEKAFKTLGKKHGVNFDLGKMTYYTDENKITVKTVIIPKGGPSKSQRKVNKLREDYKNWKPLLGLPNLSTLVNINGENHKIMGYNNRAKKYPIEIKSTVSGTEYKISVGMLHENI